MGPNVPNTKETIDLGLEIKDSCLSFRAKDLMTRRTAYTAMIISSLTLAVVNVHVFVMHHLGTLHGKSVACKVNETKYQFWELNVIPWIDLILYAILPSIIIVICNAAIVHALMRNKKQALGKGDTSAQNLSIYLSIRLYQCFCWYQLSLLFVLCQLEVISFVSSS